MTKFSFVIPCFNPEENWEIYLKTRMMELENGLSEKVRVILVNDGSTMGMSQKYINYLTNNLDDFQLVVLNKNQGKGVALRAGILQSKSDFTIFTDIDFPYTNESMVKLCQKLVEGNDVAIGVRGNDYYLSIPKFRKRLSYLFRYIFKRFFNLVVDDTQCGLKGFGKTGKEYFLKTKEKRYLVDFEFIKSLSKVANVNVKPVKVALRDNVRFTTLTVGVLLKETIRFLKIVIR